MIQNSNNWRIHLDDVEVPDVTNVNMGVTGTNIVVTTRPTGGHVERIAGRRDAIVSFDAFLDADQLGKYSIGQRLRFRFGLTTRFWRSLTAYIKDVSYVGDVDGAPNYSITVETSGPLAYIEGLAQRFPLAFKGMTLCFKGQELCGPGTVRLGALCFNGDQLAFKGEILSGPRI